MAKVIEMRVRGLICSIPLSEAVYCENCVAISNSPPDQCGVCGSEGVLRIEPILDRPPAPSPVAAMRAASPLPACGQSPHRDNTRNPFRTSRRSLSCFVPPEVTLRHSQQRRHWLDYLRSVIHPLDDGIPTQFGLGTMQLYFPRRVLH